MITAFAVFAFCMTGCSLQAYFLGRRSGIQSTVQYFIDQGILEVDDE